MNKIPNFLMAVFKSGTAVILGGTLGIGMVIVLLLRLGGKMGKTYLFLTIGGVVLIAVLIALVYLIWRFMEKRRKEKMEGALGEEASRRGRRKKEEKIAVEDLKARWAEAMRNLNNSNVDLYQLPWVLLIGEPRSGKTTTLRESGLDFFMGKDKVSGAGGTVNCDWWFTREAVIIDTAGRFTMPVDSAPDAREWQAFLRLLSKHRPRCPINGVVVTIPADSLLENSAKEIQDKAYKIREKLQELSTVLKLEFPVYIMISKLDLVYGFSEFCDSLSASERAQVVGWNRKKLAPVPFDPSEFTDQFDNLAKRIHYWSLRRLKELNLPNDADAVYAFPGQFGQLKENLGRYLGLIFAQDPYHTPFLWRGCFFSSGLQEGKAIANALMGTSMESRSGVMTEFAQSFLKSRSYFITEFYNKVFCERGHVKRSGLARRREIISRGLAVGLTLLFLMGAGMILFPGYRSLSQTVSPLNEKVKEARIMLNIKDKNYNGPRLEKVLNIAEAMENGRTELETSGVRRFLKGRENQLLSELGQIQDALVEKEIILLALMHSGRYIAGLRQIGSDDEKALILSAMGEIMRVVSGGAYDASLFSPVVETALVRARFVSEEHQERLSTLLTKYPRGDKSGQYMRQQLVSDRMIQVQFRRCLLLGLGNLRRYWEHYGEDEWQTLKKQVVDIDSAYQKILAVKSGEKDAGREYQDRIKQFSEYTLALTSGNQEHLTWSDTLPAKCASDYDYLMNVASGPLSGILQRHSQVCEGLAHKVTNVWPEWLGENSHILAETGEISSQLHKIKDLLEQIVDARLYFDQSKKDRLEREYGDPTSLLSIWSDEWNQRVVDLEKQVQETLASVTASGWQKNRLAENLSAYLAEMIWDADKAAVETAMHHVLKDASADAWRNASLGGDPPNAARVDWLLKRFEILDNLYRWIKVRHPKRKDLVVIRSTMGRNMAMAQYQLVKYWAHVIQSYDPGARLKQLTSWDAFRKAVVSSRGLFLDSGSWPLRSLLASVSTGGFGKIKAYVEDAGGRNRIPSDMRTYEQRIGKTVYLYTNGNYLSGLEQSQIDFIEGVKSHGGETGTFENSGTASNPDLLNALSNFNTRVSRDSRARGEILIDRLVHVEKHAKKLLKGHQDRQFTTDWQDFISKWELSLGNRFPFGSSQNWRRSVTSGSLEYKMVSLKELHDFFFSDPNGLMKLAELYDLTEIEHNSSGSAFLSSDQIDFLKKCLAWKQFVFDDQRRPKKHRVVVLIDSGNNRSSRAGAMFTSLQFKGLYLENGAPLILRFSGSQHKRKEFLWDPRSVNQISIDARHVEKTAQAGITVSGGALTLPAFIISSGNRQDSTVLHNEWFLDIGLPNVFGSGIATSDESDLIYIPIRFLWDEDLPDSIQWPL
jgi:membrane protein implicated in regulation of membrane protease activity